MMMTNKIELRLYWHNMDDFENYGFDDEEHKVYETGLKWCAFRINNRLHNDGFTEAKKFILTNGSKLYGIKTLEGVTKYDIDRECCRVEEGKVEYDNECLTWAKELIKKISAISNSINNATTIQQLYKIFLQDIQKALLNVKCKEQNNDNNFLYLNGKDIVDYFCKNSAVNKTIKISDFGKNNISTNTFKQKILDEIFQKNTGGMAEIEFVKAFLEKATQHIVDAIGNKIEKLNKCDLASKTNGETTPPINETTRFEGQEHNDINNNTATTCGCFKGFSLCGW